MGITDALAAAMREDNPKRGESRKPPHPAVPLLVAGALCVAGGIWMQLAPPKKPRSSPQKCPPCSCPAPRACGVAPARAPAAALTPDAGLPPLLDATVAAAPDAAATTPDAAAAVTVAPPPAAPGTPDAEYRRKAVIKEAIKLDRQGKHDQAVRLFKVALGIRDSSGLRFLLAQSYESAGRPRHAIVHLRSVSKKKPDVA